MKCCSIKGCDKKYYAKSYCRRHYKSNYDHNDPLFVDNEVKIKTVKNEETVRRARMNNQQLTNIQVLDFQNRLSQVRKILGYTYIQMEELLGIHRTTISRWERGLCVPNENVNILKDILDYAVKKLA